MNIHSISDGCESNRIARNMEALLSFYTQEDQKITTSQRLLEQFSCFIGQPFYLGIILLFVPLWIVMNGLLSHWGVEFDPPPFLWLQGIVGIGALLTATVMFARQSRLARLEEQRAHLDLKVTLLIEQKTAKLIDLMEELRCDLPNVKNRHDAESVTLKQSMTPESIIAALEEGSVRDK